MTPIYKQLLNEIIYNDYEPKSKTIAHHFTQAIVDKRLPLGSRVPSYRKMAKYMKLSPNTLAATCRELKYKYKIIVTNGALGTYIVSRLPEEIIPAIDFYALPDPKIQRIFLDQITIVKSKSASSNMESLFNKAKKIFNVLSIGEVVRRNSELLIPELKKLVNHKIQLSYTDDEIYYLQDYRLLIFTLCKALLPGNSVFVMTKPISSNLERIVLSAGKKVETFSLDKASVGLDYLEKICKEKKVGIVCISSSIVPTFEGPPDSAVLQRLKELELVYKFKILIDDRHIGLIDMTNLLNNHFFDRKESLIFIRPITLIHEELNTVNVVAAPKKVIGLLKKRLRGKTLIDPFLGSVLTHLLYKNVMAKEEVIIFSKIEALQIEVRAQLKSTSFWEESYINCNRGWFYYLKPTAGILTPDLFEQLAKSYIFIMDPSSYDLGPLYKGGILVSFASNLNSYSLHKDIEKLHKTIINLSNLKD